MEASEIRKKYVKLDEEISELRIQQRGLAQEVKTLLDKEEDQAKRKDIIDFIFKDKVEEVLEYYFRKTYIEGRTDLL